jgi:hypothetical protein
MYTFPPPNIYDISTCLQLVCNFKFEIYKWVDASYGGSKAARIPIPKVHINININIKIKNQCLVGLMKSTKEKPYLDLRLERKKMKFYRIMIFLPF